MISVCTGMKIARVSTRNRATRFPSLFVNDQSPSLRVITRAGTPAFCARCSSVFHCSYDAARHTCVTSVHVYKSVDSFTLCCALRNHPTIHGSAPAEQKQRGAQKCSYSSSSSSSTQDHLVRGILELAFVSHLATSEMQHETLHIITHFPD